MLIRVRVCECDGRCLLRLLARVAGGRRKRKSGEGRGLISEAEKREGVSKSKEGGGEGGPVTVGQAGHFPPQNVHE